LTDIARVIGHSGRGRVYLVIADAGRWGITGSHDGLMRSIGSVEMIGAKVN
jgi:hypothetical protein